jgi:hypothetical protein
LPELFGGIAVESLQTELSPLQLLFELFRLLLSESAFSVAHPEPFETRPTKS